MPLPSKTPLFPSGFGIVEYDIPNTSSPFFQKKPQMLAQDPHEQRLHFPASLELGVTVPVNSGPGGMTEAVSTISGSQVP